MATAREEALELIEKLPDESTFEDIQYHLYVLSKIEKAIAQVEAGRVLTHEEVEARAQKWLQD